MNGDRVGDLGRGDQSRHIEIALRGGRRSDTNRLIGQQNMFEIGIDRGVRCNGLDAEFLASTDNSQGDLSAVCDQNLVKHRAVNLRL